MKTSPFGKLRNPTTIVLSAGHGEGDPGAENGAFKEADQAVVMVDEIAKQLRKAGLSVDVVPHEFGLKKAIQYVNKHHDANSAWAIEIHRDSADGLPMDQASNRCGVYHYPSKDSAEIATSLVSTMRQVGAHGTSWARPDTASRHGSLAWMRQTKPVAHLLELGFMEGENTKTHLLKLAGFAARAVYETFTGLDWDDNSTEAAPAEKKPDNTPAPVGPAVPVVPMAIVTPASSLLEQLVAAYKEMDMVALFKKLGADVHPEEFDDLRNATLAQWILESGWMKSPLAQEHINFGGLKWRAEMEKWTEAKDGVVVKPVKYKAWDGWGDYCKFESPSAYIKGYWRFIMRSPYQGWTDHSGSPKDYISYLLKCGYTVSDSYLGEVMSLVPKAIALLAGSDIHAQVVPAVTSSVPPQPASVTEAVSGPGEKNAPVAKGAIGDIGSDHWLGSAKRAAIPGGNPITPLYVVIHYTEGYGAESSISGWKKRTDGILAHVVVERDGTIYQCRPFNRSCGHAGGQGLARWQDPLTAKFYDGANSVSIGIEIANTGMQTGLHKKLNTGKPYPNGTTVNASHRNGNQGSGEARDSRVWEEYPKAQLQAVFDLVSLLKEKYDLHDITGHDCISPERKADPGPAFPMLELRKANGLAGLPVVWDKKGKQIEV